jgi:hypothetical protein
MRRLSRVGCIANHRMDCEIGHVIYDYRFTIDDPKTCNPASSRQSSIVNRKSSLGPGQVL